jgi:hypothetical protein
MLESKEEKDLKIAYPPVFGERCGDKVVADVDIALATNRLEHSGKGGSCIAIDNRRALVCECDPDVPKSTPAGCLLTFLGRLCNVTSINRSTR